MSTTTTHIQNLTSLPSPIHNTSIRFQATTNNMTGSSYISLDFFAPLHSLFLVEVILAISFMINILQAAELQEMRGPMNFMVEFLRVCQFQAIFHAR